MEHETTLPALAPPVIKSVVSKTFENVYICVSLGAMDTAFSSLVATPVAGVGPAWIVTVRGTVSVLHRTISLRIVEVEAGVV